MIRHWASGIIAGIVAASLMRSACAQSTPPVDNEIRNLASDDFDQRHAAIKQLQGIVAEQLRQRAAIQEVMSSLQNDLASQAMMQGNMSDGAPVRAFYAFWKDHHAQYGIKAEPSSADVPPPPGRGRGGGGRTMPIDPPVQPNGKFPLNNGGPAIDVAPAPDAPPMEAPAPPMPLIRGRAG